MHINLPSVLHTKGLSLSLSRSLSLSLSQNMDSVQPGHFFQRQAKEATKKNENLRLETTNAARTRNKSIKDHEKL
jgi:hypothetical protein